MDNKVDSRKAFRTDLMRISQTAMDGRQWKSMSSAERYNAVALVEQAIRERHPHGDRFAFMVVNGIARLTYTKPKRR